MLVLVTASGCLNGPDAPGADAPDGSDAPADLHAGEGWPELDDAVLRPGVKVPGCTTNFLFRSPDNATLYLGTASHCFQENSVGDRIRLDHSTTLDLGKEGIEVTLAYCSFGTMAGADACGRENVAGLQPDDGPEAYNDFALLAIDADDRHLAHPAVRHWGGPTRLLEGLPAVGDGLVSYGNSGGRDFDQGTDDDADVNHGVVIDAQPHRTWAEFALPTISGDSGSPVMMADGAALGVMTTGGGASGIADLRAMLDYLHENTDLEVELVTWDLLEAPIVPAGGRGDASA